MYSMMTERKCRGKYFVKRGFEEFENGTFLGFGIDFEEFESGPAQYTTAIVELADGQVVVTTPDQIQFVRKRGRTDNGGLLGPVGAAEPSNDEIPSNCTKGSGTEKQEPREAKEKPKKRKRIDYGKIMALRNAGWSNEKIADEMRMTKASVATAISTYKKKHAGGVIHDLLKLWAGSKNCQEQGAWLRTCLL